MIIIEISRWNGFSIKKGILKGKHSSAPLKTIRLGFVVFTVLERNTKKLLLDAMGGLSSDSDWLIKNTAEFDELLRKEKQEYIKQDESRLRESISRLEKDASKLREDNVKLSTENHQLRQAIRIVG